MTAGGAEAPAHLLCGAPLATGCCRGGVWVRDEQAPWASAVDASTRGAGGAAPSTTQEDVTAHTRLWRRG